MGLSAVTDKNLCKCNDNKRYKTVLEQWHTQKKQQLQFGEY